jgi:CRP/FNR family transcriptional regulator
MNPAVSEKLANFFSTFRSQHYQKGEVILEPEMDPTGVYQIKTGSVKMTAITANGMEVVLNTFKAGAFFPMGWALNNTPNAYFYQAAEPVELKKSSKEEFLRLLSDNPDIVYDLMQRIYRGLDGLFMRMEYLMAGSAFARVLTELIIMAKRFGKTQGSGVHLEKITEKELAAQTGITRETVSREFKKLTEKGLIEFKQNELVITNLKELEKKLSDEQ